MELTVFGLQLDSMTLKVFWTLNDSMILINLFLDLINQIFPCLENGFIFLLFFFWKIKIPKPFVKVMVKHKKNEAK